MRTIHVLTSSAAKHKITRNHRNASHFTHQPQEVVCLKTPPDQAAWEGDPGSKQEGDIMMSIVRNLWHEDQGQDIAEYAVMLAVILVIVVGTIRLVGSNANNVFSSVGSAVQ